MLSEKVFKTEKGNIGLWTFFSHLWVSDCRKAQEGDCVYEGLKDWLKKKIYGNKNNYNKFIVDFWMAVIENFM